MGIGKLMIDLFHLKLTDSSPIMDNESTSSGSRSCPWSLSTGRPAYAADELVLYVPLHLF